jgi:outer membrane protein assembly factor BamB
LVLYLHGANGHAPPETLIAAHTRNGSEAWRVALPGFASVDGDASHLCISFSGQTAQITYLASADGKAAWSRTWPSSAQLQTSASAPVVYQDSVYVGVTNYDAHRDPTLPSTVYALSTTDGAPLWHQTITGLLSFPVETNRL